jgi:excinuclease ABC A subunit
MESITIKGARVHNLKNIDISIPKNKLIVATGISGSGKSSLVFDIIFEEGRKQYLQSLGILAGFDDENKFDSISGLGPTIAVQQNNIRQSNTRSTVGSRTNIIAMLALLYAAEGQITCTSCGTPVGGDLVCPNCGRIEERLPATYFSYNSPNGMCLKCSGKGASYEINLEKLAPDNFTTLEQVFHHVEMTPGYLRLFQRNYLEYLNVPFFKLPEEVRDEVIYGHYVTNNSEKRSACLTRIFQARLYRGEDLEGLYGKVICPACLGFRIGDEARRVFLNSRHIGELGQMTLSELHSFLEDLPQQGTFMPFGKNLLKDILSKTHKLIKSRLGHLSLYRETPSLSGGEIQRLFLNAHLESKMDSLIYVLDEPTAGLHESEKSGLLNSIQELKALGNTVIVVEHDRSTIQMAEHIIDIGPKAGVEGGQVIYQGDLAGLLRCKDSITGQYLSGQIAMPARTFHSKLEDAPCLTIRHAQTNNLKDVSVSFPLGGMVGIAGVSGSGKSSLVSDTLLPLLKRVARNGASETDEDESDEENEPITAFTVADRLEGLEYIGGYAEISQAPIGRNMNSNPASYVGIWDKIRSLFAGQPEALNRQLSASHFSFNSKGACSVCGGSGYESIWLGGDLKINKLCSKCHGKRFNEEALSVTFQDKNIHDVLEMSIAEAVEFFANHKSILPTLKVMARIGMGYIKLGQPTPTLSGGEAQRVKLAKEIGRRRKGNILYVLDEPTAGLSLYDTARLIELLDELVANGNSVIVIEHHTEVLAACDWIIELGPGGGADGGMIIAEGTSEMLKRNPQSLTGRYL